MYATKTTRATRALSATLAVLMGSACSSSDDGDGRLVPARISGRVLLADIPGLDDLSRVRIDIGAGEGGEPVEADGSFAFLEVEPDIYALKVLYQGSFEANAAASAYQPLSVQVAVPPNAPVYVGELTPKLGVGRISGTVQFIDNAPVSGAVVTLRGRSSVREADVVDGAFAFEDVEVGHYALLVDKDGARTASSMAACGAAVTLSHHGQEVTDSDFRLDDAAVNLEPGVDETFSATADRWFLKSDSATINIQSGSAVEGRIWRDGEAAPGYTSLDNNRFRVSELPAGETVVWLQFRDLCGSEAEPRSLTLVRDANPPVIEFARIAGGAEFIAERTVNLAVSAFDDFSESMQMRFTLCEIKADAFVCDPDIQATPWVEYALVQSVTLTSTVGRKGVRVQIRDQSLNETEVVEAEVYFDDQPPTNVAVMLGDGSGFLESASPEVTIRADGEPIQMRRSTRSGLADVPWVAFQSPAPFTFSTGDGLKQLHVQVRDVAGNVSVTVTATATLDSLGAITGVMTREGQTDHSGIVVSLDGTSFLTNTSSTGAFALSGVPAGFYDLRATSPGHRQQRIFDLRVRPRQTRDLGTLVLPAARGRVAGVVQLEGQTNNGGVRVEMLGTQSVTYSDSNGVFILSVPPGTYSSGIRVEAPRYETQTISGNIVVLEEQTFDLGQVLLLATDNDIIGSLTLVGGSSHAGLQVRADGESGSATEGEMQIATTNANGDFILPILPIGPYRLTFSNPLETGWETVGAQVFVAAGPQTFASAMLRQRFITINGGLPRTRDPMVSLALGASDCDLMVVASSPITNPTRANGVPCASPYAYQLPGPDGVKTVYARFFTTTNPNVPTDEVSDQIDLDTTASITSFTHDGAGRTLGLGDIIHFAVNASGESDGRSTVTIAGHAVDVVLRDDGAGGDAVADDGVYELDFPITLTADVNDAVVSARFVDALGNNTTTTSPQRVTVAIPPNITNIRLQTNSQTGVATVRWRTSEPTNGFIDYGTSAQLGTSVTATYDSALEEYTAVISSLQSGTEYLYQVRAADLAQPPNIDTSNVRTFFLRPNVPEYVAALSGIGRNHVRWESPGQENIVGYHIYRATAAAGPWTTPITAQPYTHEALIYEDYAVVDGTTYFYRVSAVDASGNESTLSPPQSATPGPNVGPTSVQGALTGNVTWTERGSPYVMTGGVSVEPNAQLTVGPGTTVNVNISSTINNRHRIRAYGRFAAVGTAASPIVMTSVGGTGGDHEWGGISIESSVVPVTSTRIPDTYVGGTLFYETDIERAGGMPNAAAIVVAEDSVSVLHSSIRGSNQAIQAGSGVQGSYIRIANAEVDANELGRPNNHSWRVETSTLTIGRVGGLQTTYNLYGPVYEIRDSTVGPRSPSTNVGVNLRPICAGGPSACPQVGIYRNQLDRVRFSGEYLEFANNVLESSSSSTDLALYTVGNLITGGGTMNWVLQLNQQNILVGNRVEITTTGAQFGVLLNMPFSTGARPGFFYNTVVGNVAGCLIEVGNSYTYPNGLSLPASVFGNNFDATLGSTMCTRTPQPSGGALVSQDLTNNYWGIAATTELNTPGPHPRNVSFIADYYDDIEDAEILYTPYAQSMFPTATILSPRWRDEFTAGELITFQGMIVDAEDGALPSNAYVWRDSTGNLLGTGATLQTTLPEGVHDVWLYGTDSDNQEGGIFTRIEVLP